MGDLFDLVTKRNIVDCGRDIDEFSLDWIEWLICGGNEMDVLNRLQNERNSLDCICRSVYFL